MSHRTSSLACGLAALALLGPPAVVDAAPVSTYTAPMAMGDWKPTIDDVVNALDGLKHDSPGWVERRLGRRLRPFLEYRFQYWGERQGRKRFVRLNAFCSAFWDEAPGWRTLLLRVMDGGNCFFQAKVDAKTGELVELTVNGDG